MDSDSTVDSSTDDRVRRRKGDAGGDRTVFEPRSPKENYVKNGQFAQKNVDKMSEKSTKESSQNILSYALSGLSDRWRNWIVRGIFGWLMIGAFCVIIYLGPVALILITLAVLVKCLSEIIAIFHTVYRTHNLPWFRSLSWYFLLTSNYFFYGESVVDSFGVLVNRTDVIKWLITYHRFISFSIYMIGFAWFVMSLVKKYYVRQFGLFAWTHVALLIIVTQSYLIIQNIFEGMIWFIIPVSMIVCNDVMAYLFGFFVGRTPLIRLSPKKTWEGFIGGGISTVLFGLLASHILCRYEFFVCPVEWHEPIDIVMTYGLERCQPSYLFQQQDYGLPQVLLGISQIFGFKSTVRIYPFVLHSLAMSIFSSVIGPFGGFFASGFKRAFKIKDFGDIIPGHGGILDRFDCQFLMATFINVYITSFIRTASPQKLLQQVLNLKTEQQLQLFNTLRDSLVHRGMLQLTDGELQLTAIDT